MLGLGLVRAGIYTRIPFRARFKLLHIVSKEKHHLCILYPQFIILSKTWIYVRAFTRFKPL
jgi:hypothetical protein